VVTWDSQMQSLYRYTDEQGVDDVNKETW
jgi:hypothetical protein